MILKTRIIFFVIISTAVLSTTAQSSTNCSSTCGGNPPVRFPFGFSSSCPIRLNCTPTGNITIGGFPVSSITSDAILVNLEGRCNRSIVTFRQLFHQNFAPTSRNGILLLNCSALLSPCKIPKTTMRTKFEPTDCDPKRNNICCYSEANSDVNLFINYTSVKLNGCVSLVSALYVDLSNEAASSVEAQGLEVGWWLDGNCHQHCSKEANCTELVSPVTQQPAVRCRCMDGFSGDGFRVGVGCAKVSGSHHEFDLREKVYIGTSAVLAGLLLSVAVICWIGRKTSSIKAIIYRGKDKKNNQKLEEFIKTFGLPLPRRSSYSDIMKMTKSLMDKLGEGGYGSVYKGKLSDGHLVAVKVLSNSKGDGEDFINEVASISRTSHINVVSLLGFCLQGTRKALIYEFMSNGSLDKLIYNQRSLEWEKLFQIAIGIARGLEYLHRGCNTRILHLDIKPQNILLDEDWCPKISDFGLAKLCTRKQSIVSVKGARGTVGYMAPEMFCRNLGGVSHKSDVYSYGMMVFEMVGGRKNVEVNVSKTCEIYFPSWVYKHLEVGEDFNIGGVLNEEEKEIAKKMILMSFWCIQTNPMDRPVMSKVVDMLQGSLQSIETPPKPALYSLARSPSHSLTISSQ